MTTLLVVLLVLALLFAGLGFAAHVLWWAAIGAVAVFLAVTVLGASRRGP